MDGAAWCWVPSGLTLYPNAPMGKQICISSPPLQPLLGANAAEEGLAPHRQPWVQGLWPQLLPLQLDYLLARLCIFVDAMAEWGLRAVYCCPPSVQLVTTLNTPQFQCLLTLPVRPLALTRAGPSSSSGQVPNPRVQGLPESHGLAWCCQAGGGKRRADHPWRARET